MVKIRSIVIAVAVVTLGTALVAAKWSFTPVRVDASVADPAVVFANRDGKQNGKLTEGYFKHDGHSLHYVEAGKGETVVFLHGFPSFWYSLSRQIDALKGDYHVVAVDGLGAGKSDAPLDVEAYKLENMAAHLNALIDHVGAKKVHLVGHDWGSAFAIGFAQRYPDRVLSVTGLSAPSQNVSTYALQNDPAAKETASYVERFKSANPLLIVALGVDESIYDGAYRPLVESGKLTSAEGKLFRNATSDPRRTNAHINWYRANVPHPDDITEKDFWPSRDARVAVPALYIWGEDDQIYNKAAVTRLQSLSDRSDLIMLPGVGHWPHVRETEKVNTAIRAHIKAASRPEGS